MDIYCSLSEHFLYYIGIDLNRGIYRGRGWNRTHQVLILQEKCRFREGIVFTVDVL